MRAELLSLADRPAASSSSLVSRCQRGERRAQREFYQQYAKAMYNICLRMTNHEAEAEDVLQEAFLKAFQQIKTFKGEATVGAWLKRIVINTALNHLKRKKLDWVSMDERYDEPAEQPAQLENDKELLLRVEEVQKAMKQLPDGFRVVFSLYLLEGYDHQEIADILGVSVSTSKSQYNRAKKRMKALLSA